MKKVLTSEFQLNYRRIETTSERAHYNRAISLLGELLAEVLSESPEKCIGHKKVEQYRLDLPGIQKHPSPQISRSFVGWTSPSPGGRGQGDGFTPAKRKFLAGSNLREWVQIVQAFRD
jgi:hypothetical protein